MKKYLFILLILLIGCAPKKPKETVIKASFPGFKDSAVYLYSNGIVDTIVLDKEKSFIINVTIDKPAFYLVKAYRARNYFYAKPFDTTSFILDCSGSENLPVFQGAYASLNNYMLPNYKLKKLVYSELSALFTSDKNVFQRKLDSLEKIMISKFDSLSIKEKELQDLEKSRIKYFINSFRIDYALNKATSANDEVNHDSVDLAFLKDMDINNNYHLMFDDYAANIDKYLTHLFMRSVNKEDYKKKTDVEKKKEFFAFVDTKISSQPVRDLIKMNSLKEDLTYGRFYEYGDLVNKYVAETKDEKCKAFITKLFNNRMLLAPGNPAPGFKYKDINGKEIAFTDFKGELLYMDIWATW
jgi:hypothetical protein